MTTHESERMALFEQRLERLEEYVEKMADATNSNTLAVAEMSAQIRFATRLIAAALAGVPILMRAVEALAK